MLERSLVLGQLSRTLCPQYLFRAHRGSEKLAHLSLRAVHAHAHQIHAPPGHCLGRIRGLAAAFGVSVGVMRDALELGRRQGLVELRRGRYGGVFVADPNGAALDIGAAQLAAQARPGQIEGVLQQFSPVARRSPSHAIVDRLSQAAREAVQ